MPKRGKKYREAVQSFDKTAQHGVSVRRTAAVGAYLAGGGDGVAIELAAHGRGPPFSREELSCGTAAVSSIVGHPSV